MSLADLTDADAVLAAIHECDQIGRDAFLTKYGFRPARSYFLRHNGRSYDSKAIVGAALAYQPGVEQPLPATDFSGGEATVKRKLRELGFEVTRTGQPSYWALCANPARYRIQDAVRALETDNWTVGASAVEQGDWVIIWQTKDKEGKRGIVALGEVISEAQEFADFENSYWTDPDEGQQVERRVWLRYVVPSGLPLWLGDPRADALLGELSVAKARGGTVFKVTPEQWERILDLAGHPLSAEDSARITEAARPRRSGGGQGFRSDAATRQAVERRAMEMAQAHLRAEWPGIEIKDVSANQSYDFHCIRDGKVLQVEVKGTTGDGRSVILTKNEVELARTSCVALVVVSEIEIVRQAGQALQATGGALRYLEPWVPGDSDLVPLSYSCAVPR